MKPGTRGWIRRSLAIAALTIATAPSPRAFAEPSGADRAAAQALFDEGMKLMDAKDYAKACPKLEASNRLDGAVGTRFNLADCYEKTGKTASAWTLFLDVATATKAAGQAAREKVARTRAKALEPKLARLVVLAPHAAETPGLEVLRDDTPVADGAFGTPLPIDPGEHVVVAKAPGRATWQTKVTANAEATVTATVPALEPAAAEIAPPVAPPSQPVEASDANRARRLTGFVALGVGAAGLAVGAVTGVIAIGKNHDATHDPKKCPTENRCFASGYGEIADARQVATISTIAFAAGGVLAAGGVVLVLTSPKPAPAAGLRVTPAFGPGTAGLTFSGRFE